MSLEAQGRANGDLGDDGKSHAVDHPTSLDQVYEELKIADRTWLESALRARWTRVNAAPRSAAIFSATTGDAVPAAGVSVSPPNKQHDLTAPESTITFSEHIDRFRKHNWTETALGPMDGWSRELRLLVNLCLNTSTATVLWWGPELCCLFNEAYAPILDDRASWALGRHVNDVWPEFMKPGGRMAHAMQTAADTGLPSYGELECFFVQRADYLAELWASYMIHPIHGTINIQGYLNSVVDHTQEVVQQRRVKTLIALQRECAAATSADTMSSRIIDSFRSCDRDIPFAAIYQDPDFGQGQYSVYPQSSPAQTSKRQWLLSGRLAGKDSQHGDLPASLDEETAVMLLGSAFTRAMSSGDVQALQLGDHPELTTLQRNARSRIWSEDCSTVLLVPIRMETLDILPYILILGVNPRLQYDEPYQRFIDQLQSHVHVAVDSLFVIIERRRLIEQGERLAANEQVLLQDLRGAKQNNEHMEVRFHRMTDKSPVGMFECGANGELKYANDAWYSMTNHPRDQNGPLEWVSTILPDDRGWFADLWDRLVAGEALNFEIRFCKPYVSDDYVDGQRLEGITWVAASAYAELDSEGRVLSVLGTTADISRHKWLESFKERQASDALERKKQQEAFMDMISHEARNPLSAITLCAENSLSLLSIEDVRKDQQSQALREALDDLRTILACANHQRSIIDDVLTLSKINTGMLVVCPVPVQPSELISTILTTLTPAISQADIEITSRTDASCSTLDLYWALLDPVRFQQILVNLISNAIKFTRDSKGARRIDITLSAHTTPPETTILGPHPTPTVAGDQPTAEDSALYIAVAIRDTGCGIKAEHLEKLFERFTQGSVKTHVKYGGSGLGLHICRVLAMLQGGQIDVSSTYAEGSTFTFYVKTERCSKPVSVPVHTARRDVSHKTTTSVAAIPKAFQGHATERNHLLLVEDNLVNQKVMRKHLQRLGYHVVVANHGQEALDYLATTKTCKKDGLELDMMLMDIEMPVMDGLECVRAIRQLEQGTDNISRLPIAAITANARQEQQDIAIAAGFDAVVTKPFRMQDLESLLIQYGLYGTT